jgi:hypothetical protein
MTAITGSNLSPILKRFYTGRRIEHLRYGSEMRYLLNNFKKTRTAGEYHPVPVLTDYSPGRSATFTTAQSNAAHMKSFKFLATIPSNGNHKVYQIQNDAILRANHDAGAFIKEQVLRIDDVIGHLSDDTEYDLVNGDGYGAIGQVGNTSYATKVLTLVDDDDVRNFFPGQKCVFADTAGGAVLDSGQALTVDYVTIAGSTKTVTFTENLNEITGLSTNDYIFTEGDAAGGSTARKPVGLAGLLPTTAPSASESFWNVDRSDSWKLYGMIGSGYTTDLKGAITENVSEHVDYTRSQPDLILMSNTNVGKMQDQYGLQVERKEGKNGVAGFQHLSVWTSAGLLPIVGHPFVKNDRFYVLKSDTFEVLHLGSAPVRIFDEDGQTARAIYNNDGLEIRGEARVTMVCNAPARSRVVTLS